EGTYGIAVVSSREPDTIVAARHGSPLLVAIGTGENFVASDASAVLAHTRSVVYLDDGEIAVVRPGDYRILDLDSVEKEKAVTRVDWDLATVERGGYAHFMLKEILEQPESVRNTLRGRLLEEDGTAKLGGLNIEDEQLLQVNRIVFTACGTSWHAALIGEYMMEELARIPSEVEYASEFRYRNPIVDERTLVVGISQSGETADTLAALREAKRRGARTLGLVNVVGSTIAREVDGGIYLHAGRDEARPDRADRRSHAGRLPRTEGRRLPEGRVQRGGGEGARRPGHRGRDRGGRRRRETRRPEDRGSGDARRVDARPHGAAAAAARVVHRGAAGV